MIAFVVVLILSFLRGELPEWLCHLSTWNKVKWLLILDKNKQTNKQTYELCNSYLQYWSKEDGDSSQCKHQNSCDSLFSVFWTQMMTYTQETIKSILQDLSLLNFKELYSAFSSYCDITGGSQKKDLSKILFLFLRSVAQPDAKELRLLSRSARLTLHLQRVNVGDGDDSGSNIPGQTHEGASGHEDAYPEQIQVVATAFLPRKHIIFANTVRPHEAGTIIFLMFTLSVMFSLKNFIW